MTEEMNERMFGYKIKGYCCSQIIAALTLEDLGRENADLIAAMGAFCNGMEQGKLCGTLAAAAAMLYLTDAQKAGAETREALTEWFYDRFGGYDCEEILGGNPAARLTVCPDMIAETYEKLRELLA